MSTCPPREVPTHAQLGFVLLTDTCVPEPDCPSSQPCACSEPLKFHPCLSLPSCKEDAQPLVRSALRTLDPASRALSGWWFGAVSRGVASTPVEFWGHQFLLGCDQVVSRALPLALAGILGCSKLTLAKPVPLPGPHLLPQVLEGPPPWGLGPSSVSHSTRSSIC